MRLRTTITSQNVTGYGSTSDALRGREPIRAFVRSNGPLGSLTLLAGTPGPGLHDGDVVKATIVGNVITAYINGAQVLQWTDELRDRQPWHRLLPTGSNWRERRFWAHPFHGDVELRTSRWRPE